MELLLRNKLNSTKFEPIDGTSQNLIYIFKYVSLKNILKFKILTLLTFLLTSFVEIHNHVYI